MPSSARSVTISTSELDLETLAGHDKRFVQQWYKLKKFYYDINNLQYIRGQVQVPELGDVCVTQATCLFWCDRKRGAYAETYAGKWQGH